MLQYDRPNTIYNNGMARGKRVDFDPADVVRGLPAVEARDDITLMERLQNHWTLPLSEGARGQVLPWWELVLVPNKDTNGPSAITWRSHHVLADGLSVVSIAQDIITDLKGNKLDSNLPKSMKKKFNLQRCLRDKAKGESRARSACWPIRRQDRFCALSGAKDEFSAQSTGLLLCTDPSGPLEATKTAADVSPNDVVYACVSQDIHDYLVEQDDPVLKEKGKDLLCRTLMALAFPSSDENKSTCLRNRWRFISAVFGIGSTDNVLDRLRHIHELLGQLKTSLIPSLVMTSQNYICLILPLSFNQNEVYGFFIRHLTVFSNIPGPSIPYLFADHEVHGVQIISPNLVPQVGLISYRGQIFGNFYLDPVAIPNAHRIPILLTPAYFDLSAKLKVPVPAP